jgi:Cu/Ag efflux protein CusF
MKKLAIAAVMSGALIAVAPWISEAAQPIASSASSLAIAGISVLQAEGIVQAIDPDARTVTVKDAASGQATFSVSPETTKLSDLRAGDKVRIRMTREAVIVPVGSSAQNAQDDIATAAEIVAVDRKTGVVGLKGSKGATFHIQVSDASQTLNLASGMRVQVNYSATATVSVAAAQ